MNWNEQTAAHLYRRAGFGATEAELSDAVRGGLEATVSRFVEYDAIPNGALESRLAAMRLDPTSRDGSVRLWLTRMMFSARPLEERIALFWHSLFTAHRLKVNVLLIQDQIQVFRRYGSGSFAELCIQVARDGSMMNWLDNYTSHKDHPNENFGRELLELFTLGRGNYAESDVIAAVRAFTGWGLDDQLLTYFRYRDDWHDHGTKTFLGATGDWNGDDIVRMICAQPAHARYIATRLFAYFAYGNPEPEVVERLAAVYAANGTNIRELVRAILTSPEMYSPRAIGTKIKSPIEFVIIAARQLELTADVPDAAIYLSVQGQVPYEAPDVSGWPGGRNWIGSSALLGRMAFAERVVRDFEPVFPASPGAAPIVDALLHRLGPLEVPPQVRQELISYVKNGEAMPQGSLLYARIRGAAQLILSLPASQMC